jgi:hypothetical protein
MVGKDAAHHRESSGAAVGSRTVVVASVGMAQARAAGAVRQVIDRLADSASQFAGLQQRQVTWPGSTHGIDLGSSSDDLF